MDAMGIELMASRFQQRDRMGALWCRDGALVARNLAPEFKLRHYPVRGSRLASRKRGSIRPSGRQRPASGRRSRLAAPALRSGQTPVSGPPAAGDPRIKSGEAERPSAARQRPAIAAPSAAGDPPRIKSGDGSRLPTPRPMRKLPPNQKKMAVSINTLLSL
jgi:hypothetical protein